MTRRALKRNSAPVSLFSFLDILGGTIGILTLIIAVFLIQMGRGNQVVQMVSEGSSYQERQAAESEKRRRDDGERYSKELEAEVARCNLRFRDFAIKLKGGALELWGKMFHG